MLQFSKWKIALVLAVCLAGFVLSIPNLMPRETTDRLPTWLQPVSLGLDLQGGSYLLLEVDTGYVIREQLGSLVEGIRADLRKERIRYTELGVFGADAVSVRIIDPEAREPARQILRKLDPSADVEAGADGVLVVRYPDTELNQRINSAVEQSVEIVRRRIDELGTREPSIQRQGSDRIVVQLPGVKDPDRIKELLGQTARLTFHMVDDSTTAEEAARGRVPPGSVLLPSAEPDGPFDQYVVRKRVEVGGDLLVDAQPSFDQGRPVVSFRFNFQGAKKFGEITRENVGRPFAVVLDGRVITAPRINEPILGGSGIISGSFTVQEANDLALLLRAGALPAPMEILEERTVGPDLGADSIRAGAIASVLALVLVMVFMIVAYGTFGLFAVGGLVINMALLLGGLSALGATLTLPGIAGIVLTMGMAVDANVLIYERMREEYGLGRGLIGSLQSGFQRAFTTILDSNLTTLVAALLLFQFGSGPIRGFAVTLTLGLITSMFTAIMVNRLMIVTWVRTAKPKALPL